MRLTRRVCCLRCGRGFRQDVKPGRPRAYCSDRCERAARAEDERARRAELRRCGLCATCKGLRVSA